MKKLLYQLIAVVLVISTLICISACKREVPPESEGSESTAAIDNKDDGQSKEEDDDPNGQNIFYGLPKYSTKNGVRSSVNCGPGLENDSASGSSEDIFMVSFSKTNKTEFQKYISKIKLEKVESRKDSAGEYYTFKSKDSKYYYISYTSSNNSVKIIQDSSSTVGASELSYGEDKGSISVYQYSLNYKYADITYSEPNSAMDCGMLYIIRFADNSLMLIDSAHATQTTPTVLRNIYDFLCKITNSGENDKIHIRAWVFTHAHGDHCYLASEFIDNCASKLNVDTVMFNFPSFKVSNGPTKNGYDLSAANAMKSAFRKKFPNVNYLKLHRGQSFNFFGMSFDILYTWEDTIDEQGKWTLNNFNSTSTVIKMTYKEKSLMLLGDTDTGAQDTILLQYTKADLKADVVQAAHHGYNLISGLYSMISAPIVLVSNSRQHAVSVPAYALYSQYAASDKILYADVKTYELVFSASPIKIVEHTTR